MSPRERANTPHNESSAFVRCRVSGRDEASRSTQRFAEPCVADYPDPAVAATRRPQSTPRMKQVAIFIASLKKRLRDADLPYKGSSTYALQFSVTKPCGDNAFSEVWRPATVYQHTLWISSANIVDDGSSVLGVVELSLPLTHRHLPHVVERALDESTNAGNITVTALALKFDLRAIRTATITDCTELLFWGRGSLRGRREPRRVRRAVGAAGQEE